MFCKYCGNELPENAVVCLRCGCLVDGVANKTAENEPIALQTVEQQPTKSRKSERAAKISSIIGLSVGGISLLCDVCFFFLMGLGFAAGNEGGIILVLFSVFPLFGAFVVSPIALVMGILAFVFQKKATESSGALPVAAFALGIAAFALGWGAYLSLVLYGA